MIDAHGVHQRSEAQRASALRHRREKHTWRTGKTKRRTVMLSQVIGIEARAIVGFD